MPGIRFGLTISMYPVRDMVRAGMLAEKYGFDSVWVPDHLTDLPPSGDKVDPWTVMAGIGVQTERVMLCTGVTDVQRIHPAKTAHIVVTLDHLTEGRGALAIGAGEAMNVVPYGIPWLDPKERVKQLREAVMVIRLLWDSSREKPVSYDGEHFRLKEAWLDLEPYGGRAPPIYIGALGSPSALRLVGELGDGWFPWFNTLETFRRRCGIIREAAQKAGRSFEDLDIVILFFTAVTEDEELVKRAINALKAEILVLNHRRILKDLGFEVDIPPDKVYSYQKVLATNEAAEYAGRMAEAMPDEVATQFMVVGSVEDCIERIERFVKEGATHIALRDVIGQYLHGSVDVAEKTIRTFGEKIIPYFKEQRK